MTVTLQRMIRCGECGRPTGQTFEQDVDEPPIEMPYRLCSNCDLDVLPAPWRPVYDEEPLEDIEGADNPAPTCSRCGFGVFDIRVNGRTVAEFSNDEFWCYDCGQFEYLVDAVPVDQRSAFRETADSATLHCHNCGTQLPAPVQW